MNHPRGSLGANVALAAAAAGTAWIATYAWRGFTETPGGFLNPLFLLAVVVAGTGLAARWWRWPGPVVVAAQVAVSGMVACLLLTGSSLPVGDAWGELGSVLSAALESSQQYRAPVPDTAPPIDPVLILCGLLCLLLVDVLACTLHRVPLAGLPLLTIYSIPVSLVGSSISWWVFAATAGGFLTMLFLQESDQVSRWGRPIGEDRETGDPISFGAGKHAVRSTAGSIGGVATALAVLLPALVPTAGLHVFDIGPGGGGGEQIRVENPTADLIRDLKQGVDTPLIRLTTTDPDPSYLRLVTLTRFNEVEWSPGDRDVPIEQQADGQLPPPEGVAAEVSRRELPYDVTILPAFDSTWLPTPFPAGRVQAPGDWRYDEATMDFLAVPDDLTTAGLHYSTSALELDLTADRLEQAGSAIGKVSEAYTDVPADIPPIVRELAVEVTRHLTTRFDKAVALQNWFRQEFTYSLATADGNGPDALVDFLSEGPGGRTGYCEQFASAMAVMARLLGIPARVAIGFLHPTPVGSSTWVYTSRDMHAWPELYFDGAGWVRFEPTPSDRADDVPSYTLRDLPPTVDPTDPAATQTSDPTLGPTNRPTESQDQAADVSDEGGAGAGGSWGPLIGGGAMIVVVAAVLLLPRLVRRRRRERRLGVGGPEHVWAELRDTAVDLGVPWPAGRSPRATRDTLVDHLGVPVSSTTPDRPRHGPAVAPEGVAALDRIVAALELARYSRPGTGPDRTQLRADAETCIASLCGGSTRSARRQAGWWPRSVLTFAARRPRPTTSTVEARYGGVVDRVN